MGPSSLNVVANGSNDEAIGGIHGDDGHGSSCGDDLVAHVCALLRKLNQRTQANIKPLN